MAIITDVNELLRASRQHKNEYYVDILGLTLLVHPEVFSPKYSYSSTFITKNWDIQSGMRVLDIGTGTGILGILAAKLGAHVVLADKNPHAVRIAQHNAQLNDIEAEVYLSDMFATIPAQTFDRIVFNAPYWNKKANDLLEMSCFDYNFTTLKTFLTEAPKCLSENGKILLAHSTQSDINYVEQIIAESKLITEQKLMQTKGHTRVLYTLYHDKNNST